MRRFAFAAHFHVFSYRLGQTIPPLLPPSGVFADLDAREQDS